MCAVSIRDCGSHIIMPAYQYARAKSCLNGTTAYDEPAWLRAVVKASGNHELLAFQCAVNSDYAA